MYTFKLNEKPFESENPKITGKQILTQGELQPTEDYELLIKVAEKGFEPVQLSEVIDLRGAGIEGFVAKPYEKLTVFVDERPVEVPDAFCTPNKLLELAGKVAKNYYLVQISGEIEISYKNDREHKIAIVKGAKFISYEVEIIDVQDHCHNGTPVPPDCKYKIMIDREKYVVDDACITGKDILHLTGKTPPDRFQLRQKFKDGRVITIKNDQVVCFTEPGVEKFKTIPLDQTEGCATLPRREFHLLEEDESYLSTLGLTWEAAKLRGENWIIIHNYPVPEGYNVSEASIAIRMVGGYPTAGLDMVYFQPALQRVDRQPIGALTPFPLDARQYQQWSRHRTRVNPWRSGVDNLSTHLALADFWLLDEFRKRPAHVLSA